MFLILRSRKKKIRTALQKIKTEKKKKRERKHTAAVALVAAAAAVRLACFLCTCAMRGARDAARHDGCKFNVERETKELSSIPKKKERRSFSILMTSNIRTQ